VTGRRVRFRLAVIEGVHLRGLVEEFEDLVGGSRDAADPAIVRLTPTPYPEDAEASAAFAESTRGDLLDRRSADATAVRSALAVFDADVEALTEAEALRSAEIVIAADDIDSWLRTLTALRLVLASRLGIAEEDRHDTKDPRFALYDWLGYRLEVLIQAADEQD